MVKPLWVGGAFISWSQAPFAYYIYNIPATNLVSLNLSIIMQFFNLCFACLVHIQSGLIREIHKCDCSCAIWIHLASSWWSHWIAPQEKTWIQDLHFGNCLCVRKIWNLSCPIHLMLHLSGYRRVTSEYGLPWVEWNKI